MTLRLVVVDDHPIVRDGLAGIFALEKDIDVVGQAGSGPEALAVVAERDPDLVKDLPRDQLVAAVRELMNGSPRTYIDAPHGSQLSLTNRETDVLALVADGLTNRAVARKLGISEATVKTHLAHVYTKLGVLDRATAVREAWERGLV